MLILLLYMKIAIEKTNLGVYSSIGNKYNSING